MSDMVSSPLAGRGLSLWQGIIWSVQEPGRSNTFLKEVVSDNVESGEGNDDVLEVGLTHSRGVGGVTPGDSQGMAEGLEGVSDQSKTDRETPSAHRSAEWVGTRLCVISERWVSR